MIGRRWICAGVAVALLAMGAGKAMGQSAQSAAADHRRGLLHARPHLVHAPSAVPGTEPLGINPRDGLLYVPTSYRPDRPPPLMLLLHGAGARAEDILRTFRQIADKYGVLLAVPSSRRQSWDIVLGEYGEDVARIDKALSRVLDRYAVDPARVAIAGFSDGASYALSLGILNGALFTHVLAFSPGFTPSSKAAARPQIFIAHGIKDSVLPIDQTSRKIVARLRHNGFEPVYREFPDGHMVPPDLADEAFAWFVRGKSNAAVLQGQLVE
jgi:phospholipase/carboxylesterase